MKGREQKQEPGNVTKAPGPLSPEAYHHFVHTVTSVWDTLCRKLESKRNRRETIVSPIEVERAGDSADFAEAIQYSSDNKPSDTGSSCDHHWYFLWILQSLDY